MKCYRCIQCAALHNSEHAAACCCPHNQCLSGLYGETNLPGRPPLNWFAPTYLAYNDAPLFAKLYELEHWIADLKNSMDGLHNKIDSLRSEDE